MWVHALWPIYPFHISSKASLAPIYFEYQKLLDSHLTWILLLCLPLRHHTIQKRVLRSLEVWEHDKKSLPPFTFQRSVVILPSIWGPLSSSSLLGVAPFENIPRQITSLNFIAPWTLSTPWGSWVFATLVWTFSWWTYTPPTLMMCVRYKISVIPDSHLYSFKKVTTPIICLAPHPSALSAPPRFYCKWENNKTKLTKNCVISS